MIIWLLFAHHLADVAFQPSWLIANKKKHWFSIYEHAMVWTGIVSLTLLVLGVEPTLWKMLFLLIGHFLIDFFKYKQEDWFWIYPDQLAHYLQIIIVYYI